MTLKNLTNEVKKTKTKVISEKSLAKKYLSSAMSVIDALSANKSQEQVMSLFQNARAMAVKNDQLDIFESQMRIAHSAGNNALTLCAGRGYLELAKKLIDCGLPTTQFNYAGSCAITWFLADASLEIVQYLMSKGKTQGFELDQIHESTYLHYIFKSNTPASNERRVEIAKKLLMHWESVGYKNLDKELDYAINLKCWPSERMDSREVSIVAQQIRERGILSSSLVDIIVPASTKNNLKI